VQWISANGYCNASESVLRLASARFVWLSPSGATEQDAIAVAEAHERGFALVDAVPHGGDSLWDPVREAVSRGLALPNSSGARHYVSNRHFSVAVAAAKHAHGVPEELGGAAMYVLSARLLRAGYGVTRVEVGGATRRTSIVTESWLRGRAGAHSLSEDRPPHQKPVSSRFLLHYLVKFIPHRVHVILRRSGREHSFGIGTRTLIAPAVLASVTAYWCGLWFELLRPGGARRFR
jgi:hypothetical protein